MGHGMDNALRLSVNKRHESISQLLLEAGARTSSEPQNASERGHVPVVELLLGADAPVNARGGRSGKELRRA